MADLPVAHQHNITTTAPCAVCGMEVCEMCVDYHYLGDDEGLECIIDHPAFRALPFASQARWLSCALQCRGYRLTYLSQTLDTLVRPRLLN